jgi:hypothetical protein
MTKEDLTKQLEEKQLLLKKVEATYHQLFGQIELLQNLIEKENKTQ